MRVYIYILVLVLRRARKASLPSLFFFFFFHSTDSTRDRYGTIYKIGVKRGEKFNGSTLTIWKLKLGTFGGRNSVINRRQYPPMCTSSCEKNVVNSFEKYSIEYKINVKSFLAYLIHSINFVSKSSFQRNCFTKGS